MTIEKMVVYLSDQYRARQFVEHGVRSDVATTLEIDWTQLTKRQRTIWDKRQRTNLFVSEPTVNGFKAALEKEYDEMKEEALKIEEPEFTYKLERFLKICDEQEIIAEIEAKIVHLKELQRIRDESRRYQIEIQKVEQEKQKQERTAKVEQAKRFVEDWIQNFGSELLKARFAGGYNYKKLFQREFSARFISDCGLDGYTVLEYEDYDDRERLENPSLAQIREHERQKPLSQKSEVVEVDLEILRLSTEEGGDLERKRALVIQLKTPLDEIENLDTCLIAKFFE